MLHNKVHFSIQKNFIFYSVFLTKNTCFTIIEQNKTLYNSSLTRTRPVLRTIIILNKVYKMLLPSNNCLASDNGSTWFINSQTAGCRRTITIQLLITYYFEFESKAQFNTSKFGHFRIKFTFTLLISVSCHVGRCCTVTLTNALVP